MFCIYTGGFSVFQKTMVIDGFPALKDVVLFLEDHELLEHTNDFSKELSLDGKVHT